MLAAEPAAARPVREHTSQTTNNDTDNLGVVLLLLGLLHVDPLGYLVCSCAFYSFLWL